MVMVTFLLPGIVFYLQIDIDCVEICTVNHSHPCPSKKQYKISVVEMSHTVSSKHTMMLSLKNAEFTGGTMPRSRGCYSFTNCTVMPIFSTKF